MFLIDTREGHIVDDEEIKKRLAAEQPYAEWLAAGMVSLDDLPEREHVVFSHAVFAVASRSSVTPMKS